MSQPIPWAKLEAAARAAAWHSHSPYSGFAVGAAVLTGEGRVYAGTNVENASYGLSNCVERTAVFTAIAAGAKTIAVVVVYTPTPEPTSPCGACRQVIPEALCLSVCDGDGRIEERLEALLPHGFGPESL